MLAFSEKEKMAVDKDTEFRNELLNAIPAESLERLLPNLERYAMDSSARLYQANDKIRYVYFPEDSIISILATTEEGQSTEIAIVGREGAVGLDVVMGAESLPHDFLVQMPDSGYRISADAIRAEFDACTDAQPHILRFIQKLMVQISQTTLCNRLHRVDERLARWLLMCHDRAGGDTLRLTQEFLAMMLGVARVSVTLSASEIQSKGYIKYSRGSLDIVDRDALEKMACECYGIVRDEYARD
jgi:CRP-like cAMP-binding protein